MAKKERIEIPRSDEMAAVDAELEEALGRLDETNSRVDRLLTEYFPAKENSGGGSETPAKDAGN
jgi:hypothetical protein